MPSITSGKRSTGRADKVRCPGNSALPRGSWDFDLLRSELRDLKFSGFDLDLIGFEPHRLEEILAGLGSSGMGGFSEAGRDEVDRFDELGSDEGLAGRVAGALGDKEIQVGVAATPVAGSPSDAYGSRAGQQFRN